MPEVETKLAGSCPAPDIHSRDLMRLAHQQEGRAWLAMCTVCSTRRKRQRGRKKRRRAAGRGRGCSRVGKRNQALSVGAFRAPALRFQYSVSRPHPHAFCGPLMILILFVELLGANCNCTFQPFEFCRTCFEELACMALVDLHCLCFMPMYSTERSRTTGECSLRVERRGIR